MKLSTFITSTIVAAGLGAAAAVSVAEQPTEKLPLRDPAAIPDGVAEKFRKLELERQPVEKVRKVQLLDRTQSPLKVRGYVHRVEDGTVLIAVELTPEEVTGLDPRRARVIDRLEDADTNTRFGNQLFVRYTVDPTGTTPIESYEARVGEHVELELMRSAEGRPYVTFLRTGVGPRGAK